jgi:flagellar basal-body rod modification protein FlgD
MNALVSLQASPVGTIAPTPQQRAQMIEKLNSTVQAKWKNVLRNASLVAESEDVAKDLAKAVESTGAAKSDDGVSEAIDQELDRDAFLQLLVAQLQNQDPMAPTSNEDMIAQLAQFSSLEQMESLNDSFETLAGNIDQLNFISASGLVGHEISGVNEEGYAVQGTVDAVHLDGSLVYLNVGGELISMAGVLAVE